MMVHRTWCVMVVSFAFIGWPNGVLAQDARGLDLSTDPLVVEMEFSAKECYVDQRVPVRVRVCNDSAKRSAKRQMWLTMWQSRSVSLGTTAPMIDIPSLGPKESHELTV